MEAKIGIDVSKDKLDCAWLKDLETIKVKSKVAKNSRQGIQVLVKWVEHTTQKRLEEVHFIMEATGVYHELLAHTLYDMGAKVSVVNPARIKEYAKSLGSRSKTDKKDSVVIARYGANQRPDLWQPEPAAIRQLKALIGRLDAIEKDIQREENRLEKAQITPVSKEVIRSIRTVIAELNKEKVRIEQLISSHIDQHPDLKQDKQLLASIPGIGPVMTRYMLAMIRSRDFNKATQCSAYVGLNPIMFESGTLRGRARISKAGNAKIRAKLYMAAVVATKYNPDIKAQYNRLLKRGKSKMSALCAAMRKLVQICFGVLKHQCPYQAQVA